MKSRITIGALIAVVLFFVLLYESFDKIGNEDAGKAKKVQQRRVGFILLSDTADNG